MKELEEELHVVTNNLRSLEISEEKVSVTPRTSTNDCCREGGRKRFSLSKKISV